MAGRSAKRRRAVPKNGGPEIVLRGGKPAAVILPIDEYRRLLERLEDNDDLKVLRAMRKRPLRFRKLEDFLRERSTRA